MARAAIVYCVHDDHYFLGASLCSYRAGLPVYAFVSETAWNGSAGDFHRCAHIARAHDVTVITGRWTSEEAHRRGAFEYLKDNDFRYAFVPDSDEVIETRLLEALCSLAEHNLADRVYVSWDTYWGELNGRAAYVIRPREPYNPALLVNLEQAHYEGVREFSGGRGVLLNDTYGIVHHLSYAGPPERIQRKISTYGHRDEVRDRWYETVYEQWHYDRGLRNLHPTHPESYRFAEKIYTPEVLAKALAEGEELTARATGHFREAVA